MGSTFILQGGGEHARVVLDCLLSAGADVKGIFDPKYSGQLFGVRQCGVYDPAFEPAALAVVAIGDNTLRKEVAGMTVHKFGEAIHASAILSPYASLGKGCMVLHGVIVQAQATIGNHVILNTGCTVDHDCNIGDFVHIAPGVTICGTVEIGEGTLIGAGATVLPGRKIGRWAVVGAGTVVVENVGDHAVVAGNPGRIINPKKN
jgi:sugar O-acyltransferase (sialic acid O-acetyltransferase NeuD family)